MTESTRKWLSELVSGPELETIVTAMENLEQAEQRLAWVEELLILFWDGDTIDDLWWRPTNGSVFVPQKGVPPAGPVEFSVMCSDTFAWGCADAEPVSLPDDLESLRAAMMDMKAAEDASKDVPGTEGFGFWPTLWCCRKRGERPMNAWMKKYGGAPPIRALFEAAGPSRDSVMGAP